MSGYITASNSVQTDTIDTLSATALNIGTSSATSINIGKSSIAVKSSNILMSANKIDSATGNGVLSIGTVNGSTTPTDIAVFIGKNTNTTRVQGRLQATYIDGLSSGGGTADLYLQANSTGSVRVGATSGCVFDDAGATIAGLSIYQIGGDPALDTDSLPLKIATDTTSSVLMGNIVTPVTIDTSDFKMAINGSYGTAGQVLTSQGSASSATWTTPTTLYKSGSISNPNATTRTLQAFGYTFTSTNPPKVYLTYDAGSSSTSILTYCVAGIDGVAGAWTGFYYLTSTAGASGSQLNWLATL
jgi:hypothetical protein